MSQSNSAKRPLTTLQKSTKKKVTVRLKNEVEYKGKMDNVDSYMNLIMTDAEELHDGKTIANYGRVIVRGNNVLFIKLENETASPSSTLSSLFQSFDPEENGLTSLLISKANIRYVLEEMSEDEHSSESSEQIAILSEF